jgi:Apea-like HEPN
MVNAKPQNEGGLSMPTTDAEDLFGSVCDQQLFELTCALVKSGLVFVSEQEKGDAYIGTYSDIPEMQTSDSGMPRFRKLLSGPRDYKTMFQERIFDSVARTLGGEAQKPRFESKSQPEFETLKQHMRDSPALWKHLMASHSVDIEKAFFDIEVELFIKYQIDRYIHINGTTDFTVTRFLPIYLPYETARMREVLSVNIWIPILFVLCKFPDEVVLDAGVFLRKIPDDLQLAREHVSRNDPGIHGIVSDSATHAFVLTNYEVPNTYYAEWANISTTPAAYPTEKIDLLFAMLRLVSGVDTGYAQLLMEQLGWAFTYEANLTPMTGASVRRYPPTFEEYYWNRRDLPTLDSAKVDMLGDLYRRVLAIADEKSRNRILLATRRLNQCLVRENEQDAILDATSALEALLTPGDNVEITHKLATRLAALSRLGIGGDSPWTIFKNVKKIYGYRSSVIHGDISRIQKTNTIQMSGTEMVPSVKVATDYLRSALEIVIRHPEYLDSSKIDENLLLHFGGQPS